MEFNAETLQKEIGNQLRIHIWPKMESELHRLMDIVEPIKDELTRYKVKLDAVFGEGEHKYNMSSLETAMDGLVKRMEDLDRRQPVGSKVYLPAHGEREGKGRVAFENWVADVARIRFGHQPKFYTERKWWEYRTIDGGTMSRANQTEGTNSQGGFLVPEEILPEVVALLGEFGVARRVLRRIPMTRKDMKIPTRDTGPLVYWPGEGVKPTTSSVALLRPELNSKTMMALDELSEELDADSIVPMSSLLVDLFVEAVGLEEDTQAFSASTPFTGTLQDTSVNQTLLASGTAFTDLAYNDVVGLKHSVNSKVVQNGTFVLHQDIVSILHKIKDTQGNPIWRENMASLAPAPPGTILGRPYFSTNAMSASSGAQRLLPFIYGDFRYHALGDRMQFQVDISSEAGFTEFTKWMRVVERVAFKILIASAFGRLKTN